MIKQKRRARTPDSPVAGKKIQPTSNKPLEPLNKDDFKYWKPWLPEQNIPKWAEQLQDAPLKKVLGTIKNPLEKNQTELPLQFYKDWTMTDKVKSYADLKPERIEPRLNEIFRKFG